LALILNRRIAHLENPKAGYAPFYIVEILFYNVEDLKDVRRQLETVWKDQTWADIRRTRHIGNFSRWKDHHAYQQAFERLLRDLKAEG
jgi:hypothetical protein